MKIRADFVTNSSSSSFIISRKKELTEKQKEAIVAYVSKTFLGDTEITAKNLEEICDGGEIGEREKELIKSELAKGNAVYQGTVVFEEIDMGDIYSDLWDALERADPENFNGIKTELWY